MVAQYLPEVMNPIVQLFIPFLVLESKSLLDVWIGEGAGGKQGRDENPDVW